jgi:sarcosine oxidase subunit delta
MRIKCPYCGERALEEFTYRGDATVTRPESLEPGTEQAWVDYVYFRESRWSPPRALAPQPRLSCLARGNARYDHA